MASVDLLAVVSLPQADVYAALCDLARRPRLDPTVVEVTPPEDGATPAASFSGRGTTTGDERHFDGIVTALEPDLFVALGFSFSNGARLHEQWRLGPTPSGTLVNYHAELQVPGGLFGRLLDRVMVAGGFARQREAVLARIKAALEADDTVC
jgi:hypothetical protein